MAEIWYLEVEAGTLEDQTKQERPFVECLEILELDPDAWKCEVDEMPDLKTGDSFVDSGRVILCVKVLEDELAPFPDKRWKPGWYQSKVTIVGFETKLRLKAK